MKTITRRRMTSGLGAGLAAAATPRIFAAQNVSKEDAMTTQKLEDPKTDIPSRRSRSNSSHVRDWRVKWIHAPITARKLQKLGSFVWSQSAHQRRRFRNGPGRSDRLCARRR